jgi:hypothetical protein
MRNDKYRAYTEARTTSCREPGVTVTIDTYMYFKRLPIMPLPVLSLADSKQIDCAKTMSARSSTHPPLR